MTKYCKENYVLQYFFHFFHLSYLNIVINYLVVAYFQCSAHDGMYGTITVQ
jgi:hypothetical protein